MSTGTDNEAITEAKQALENAESTFGKESKEVLECLEKLGRQLRQEKRTLDAANADARAPVIRGKLFPPDPAVVRQQADVLSVEEKKCPFCAEIIKAEAKICRYCNRTITNINLDVRKVAVMGAIGLVVLLAVVGSFGVTHKNADTQKESAAAPNILAAVSPAAKIEGAAWVVNKAGQSNIQRGLGIAL